MGRFTKITFLTLLSIFTLFILGLIVWGNFFAPLVKISDPHPKDEILKYGERMYVTPQSSYKKGDHILIKTCIIENDTCHFYQASRRVNGLPGENIQRDTEKVGKALKEIRKQTEIDGIEGRGVITATLLQEDQYLTAQPLSGEEIWDFNQDVVMKQSIYGTITSAPKSLEEWWNYFAHRIAYFPTYFQEVAARINK